MSKKKRIQVWQDHDIDNPCEYGLWRVVSFNKKDINYENYDDYIPLDDEMKELRKKGHVFILSYHGSNVWDLLKGGAVTCSTDTTLVAGILFLECEDTKRDPRNTLEVLKKSARGFLETYTQWCNGEVYGFSVIGKDGEIEESIGGFYGLDYLLECIKEEMGDKPFKIMTTKEERDPLGEIVAGMI